jgi:predicted RNase H-like HicB family nuclease
MREPVTYDAYLEVEQDGRWLDSILDLPGCFANGDSAEDALDRLVAVIPAYFAWLKTHDEYTPDGCGPWRLVTCETLRTFMLGEYEVNAFFTPDMQAVDEEELDWGLALLGWAHEDLIELVGRLSAAALDAAPPGGGWSTHQILDHVAQTQLWYVTRIDASPVPVALAQLSGETVERLDRVHQACVARLRGASEAQRTSVLVHQGERWSLRKVLRRSVWHACDHTTQIEQILPAPEANAD